MYTESENARKISTCECFTGITNARKIAINACIEEAE